ncbi:unnamed protein product, partial [marine sediment metagenome]
EILDVVTEGEMIQKACAIDLAGRDIEEAVATREIKPTAPTIPPGIKISRHTIKSPVIYRKRHHPR